MTVRPPAVAGFFYPADPGELRTEVDLLLHDAQQAANDDRQAGAAGQVDGERDGPDRPDTGRIDIAQGDGTPGPVRALLAPHAGYRFSGATAAAGYQRLDPDVIRRVVLLGPTHRVGIRGIADAGVDAFATPLGEVAIDTELRALTTEHEAVVIAPEVHAQEHSLEVHLPFLQRRLGEFTVLPLAVGEVVPDVVSELIDDLVTGPDTLVLVSSDLSHFAPYLDARHHDDQTIARIADLDPTLAPHDACGARPLNGLLDFARQQEWTCELVSACNSGDTPLGDRDRVVGYASAIFQEAR